jgi:hypothetical protein
MRATLDVRHVFPHRRKTREVSLLKNLHERKI